MKIKPMKVHQAKLCNDAGGSPSYGYVPAMQIIEYADGGGVHRKVWLRLTPDAIGDLRMVLAQAVAKYEEAAVFARKQLNG